MHKNGRQTRLRLGGSAHGTAFRVCAAGARRTRVVPDGRHGLLSGRHRGVAGLRPDVVVANAGAARFSIGRPITAADVVTLAWTIPGAKIVAVHMEAINHCTLSRSALEEEVRNAGVADRVFIPADGEELSF